MQRTMTIACAAVTFTLASGCATIGQRGAPERAYVGTLELASFGPTPEMVFDYTYEPFRIAWGEAALTAPRVDSELICRWGPAQAVRDAGGRYLTEPRAICEIPSAGGSCLVMMTMASQFWRDQMVANGSAYYQCPNGNSVGTVGFSGTLEEQ